jgi:Fibronectin type III domain
MMEKYHMFRINLNQGLMMNSLKKLSLFAALVAGVLAGCGGGITASSGTTLGGTAAVGAPIVGGTISLMCAGGSAVTPTTTSSLGAWSVTLSGQTFPCAVQVSGGTINGVTNSTPYHSIASALGTVNVTPVTDLIVANAAGTSTPNTWFAAVTPTGLAGITPAAMTTALVQVRTALNLPALNNVNPLTTAFTPAAGNPVDDILTALQLAITNTGGSLAALRTAAASPTFTPPVGFSTALNTQHANTSSGGAPAPAAPTGLATSGVTASATTVTWTAVSGATGYNVYRSTSAGVAITAANRVTANPSLSATITISGLAASTAYYYKVTALSASGESVGSSEVTATTSAAATTGGGTTSPANIPTGFVARANPSGALTIAPASIVWTGSLFVALELNQNYHSSTAKLYSWTSPDGISWTRNTTNVPNGLGALTAANGKAFMMGNGGAGLFPVNNSTVAMYSTTDGVTWTIGSAPLALGTNSTGGVPLGVKYLNNKYIATLDTAACNAITSTDGTTWTATDLNAIALPTGYFKALNNTYCSEAFYVGGKYVIAGGLIVSQTGSGNSTVFTYKGLTYTSTDGVSWTMNTFNLPSTINGVAQGGRVSTALQVGSNLVLPIVRTETSVRLQPTDPYPTQVLSNYQVGVSSDGTTFTFTTRATPNLGSTYPNLLLPNGIVGYTNGYPTVVNGATVNVPADYRYTTDGYTFTTAQDLMFTNPLMAAYSPILKRLVVFRQESNATTFAQTGVTIGTLDFP